MSKMICTGFGYLHWQSPNKQMIMIPCYFCSESSSTIISPTDIVLSHVDKFKGWQMNVNIDNSSGTFTLLVARDGINHISYPTFMRNKLWYHYLNNALPSTKPPSQYGVSIIQNMSYPALFELWHYRLGHPGTKIIEQIHKHVIGVPPFRGNKFYNCSSCMYGKFRHKPISKHKYMSTQKSEMPTTTTISQENIAAVGQYLHMDYGFVRGSDWSRKENDGKLVTCIDKYRSYLLVIDRYSRYIWIYLTKSKHPQIEQVQELLK